MLRPIFYHTDFTAMVEGVNLKFIPHLTTWQAIGGPEQADIEVIGNLVDLWEALEFLRRPVEIYNELGEAVWWGYVERAVVSTENITFNATLDSMINKVRVTYSSVSEAGYTGEQETTAFLEDTESSGYYGAKEGQFSLSDGNATQAEQYRATLLARLKYPVPKIQMGGAVGCKLICKGWFNTLSWKLFSNTAGKESYEDVGIGVQAFGDATATTKVAQSVLLAGSLGWEANQISVRMEKVGGPTDNVHVSICGDSGGEPWGVLATSADVAGSSISEYLNWHNFTFSSNYLLAPSTTYWILVERTGSLDGSNYYKIDTNEAQGYPRGGFRINNGSAWVARSPNADMLFKITGVRQTSDQIGDIVTSCGQFLAGSILDISSGVYTIPYQDGSQDGLSIILELLESGTTNNRRMLCQVTKERYLWVYEEPAVGTDDYYMQADGKLYNTLDQLLRPELYRPGVWAKLKDIIPASADVSRFATPGLVFIEETGYRDGSGYLRPRDEESLTGIQG